MKFSVDSQAICLEGADRTSMQACPRLMSPLVRESVQAKATQGELFDASVTVDPESFQTCLTERLPAERDKFLQIISNHRSNRYSSDSSDDSNHQTDEHLKLL